MTKLTRLMRFPSSEHYSAESKPVPTPQTRRSIRIVETKRASVVVDLTSHPRRIPCLIVDSSQHGFKLRGGFRLKRRQVVEVVSDDDPLRAFRCSVIWIGKPGSKQEGEAGLEVEVS